MVNETPESHIREYQREHPWQDSITTIIAFIGFYIINLIVYGGMALGLIWFIIEILKSIF